MYRHDVEGHLEALWSEWGIEYKFDYSTADVTDLSFFQGNERPPRSTQNVTSNRPTVGPVRSLQSNCKVQAAAAATSSSSLNRNSAASSLPHRSSNP